MLDLARATPAERAAYVNETAARRNVPAWAGEPEGVSLLHVARSKS